MFKEFQKEDGTQCSRLYCYFGESNKWRTRKISGPKCLARWLSHNMAAPCKYFIVVVILKNAKLITIWSHKAMHTDIKSLPRVHSGAILYKTSSFNSSVMIDALLLG